MKSQQSFSDLFAVSAAERAIMFEQAKPLHSIYGIKILHAVSPVTGPARFFIACTRGLKGAIKRNKIRRRLKALIYENRELFAEKTGIYILVLYPQAGALSFEKLRTCITALSRKNG